MRLVGRHSYLTIVNNTKVYVYAAAIIEPFFTNSTMDLWR